MKEIQIFSEKKILHGINFIGKKIKSPILIEARNIQFFYSNIFFFIQNNYYSFEQ